MVTVSPADSLAEDVDSLKERVAELERSQRQEDVEGFLGLFDPLAVWVTGGGRRLIGFEVIRAFTEEVLPGAMATGTVTYTVEHVLFIASEVALTAVQQQYFDLSGQPTSAGLPTYVWRRTNGVWRIIAGQNTAAEGSPS